MVGFVVNVCLSDYSQFSAIRLVLAVKGRAPDVHGACTAGLEFRFG